MIRYGSSMPVERRFVFANVTKASAGVLALFVKVADEVGVGDHELVVLEVIAVGR